MYTKTSWVNRTAPYLEALNLNHMEKGIFDNSNAIDAIGLGETAKGEWTPAVGTEYPSAPTLGDSYFIAGLSTPYTFVGGDLTGKETDNQDKIYYSDAGWILIEQRNIPEEMVTYVDTVANMQALESSIDDIIYVKNYVDTYPLNQEYRVFASSSVDVAKVDEQGLGFTLANGNIAVPITDNINSIHFGILPDKTVNGTRLGAFLAASTLVKVTFEGGFYDTGLNIYREYSNANIHFNNTEFSGLIHIVSTDTPVLPEEPVRDITLTGHIVTYDRFGTINIDGLFGGLNVTAKSNPSKNINGTDGRGIHIYSKTNNCYFGDFIVENTGTTTETASLNLSYAVAIDDRVNPSVNVNINSIYIKDTLAGGVSLQCLNSNIGSITIDNYGDDVGYYNVIYVDDPFGMKMEDINIGVAIANSNVNIGSIVVNQESFAGRSRSLVDVCIFDYPLGISPSSSVGVPSVVHSIECLNPQHIGVYLGYGRNGNTEIGSVKFPYVDGANKQVTDGTLRANYGLVTTNMQAKIGSITAVNTNKARLITQLEDDNYNNRIKVDNIVVNEHTVSVAKFRGFFDIGDIDIQSCVTNSIEYAIDAYRISSNKSQGRIQNIRMLNHSGVETQLLKMATDYSSVGSIYAEGVNSTTYSAVIFGGKHSSLSNVKLVGIGDTGAGLELHAGGYFVNMNSLLISNYSLGITGSGTHNVAAGCGSINNTTNSDVALSVYQVDPATLGSYGMGV